MVYDDDAVRLAVEALEDLLRPEVFAEAVNRVLSTYSITEKRVDPSKLDAKNRSGWLTKWLNRRQVAPERVQKPMICQEVVGLAVDERGDAASVVADEHREGLVRLHARIVEGLGTSRRPAGTGGL